MGYAEGGRRSGWPAESQQQDLAHHVAGLRRGVGPLRHRHRAGSAARGYHPDFPGGLFRSAFRQKQEIRARRADEYSDGRDAGMATLGLKPGAWREDIFPGSRFIPAVQTHLPIWQLHAEIVGRLREGNRLVLVAPTGSGKTTQVPQMLLDAGLAGDKKIAVLQPRRVAARTVAARVAWERNCRLGAEVGYQIRFDDQTSVGTRISYVTEGILLRWLQGDRALSDVGIVLFDEFHERNLLSDVALALVKHIQQTERPDLKLAVMSATLDAEPVAEYLSDERVTSDVIKQGR